MKLLRTVLFLLLLVASAFAQRPVFKGQEYAPNTSRSDWSDANQWFNINKTTAVTYTSHVFSLSTLTLPNNWNGVLGFTLRADSTAGNAEADTIFAFVEYYLGSYGFFTSDTLHWIYASSDTSTTVQGPLIILPGDSGKLFIWKSTPTSLGLQGIPWNRARVVLTAEGSVIKAHLKFDIYAY